MTRITLIALALVLAGCAGALHWDKATHTVRRGETLYGIAWQYGLDHRDLVRWNDIENPSLIHPGQKLRLTAPEGETGDEGRSRTAGRGAAEEGSGSSGGTSRSRAGVGEGSGADADGASRAGSSGGGTPEESPSGDGSAIAWQWPVQGQVLSKFGEGDKRSQKGIDIAGEAGDPVSASAPGRVVYSGSGLIGYGQLIIIKHTEKYLSAYGHNRKAYVDEGDDISAGQKIAEMGRSEGRAALHFEIRVRGDPVDPLPLLQDG